MPVALFVVDGQCQDTQVPEETRVITVDAMEPRSTVEAAVASGLYDGFINALPVGLAVQAVAQALEAGGRPWAGVRSRFLGYTRSQLRMAAHYEGASVPPYVVRSTAEVLPDDLGLSFPMTLRGLTVGDKLHRTVNSAEELSSAWRELATVKPTLMIEENVSGESFTLVAFGTGPGDVNATFLGTTEAEAAAEAVAVAKKMLQRVFEGVGALTLKFKKSQTDSWILEDMLPVPPVEAPGVMAQLRSTVTSDKQPNFVVNFHPKMRGYHVIAARDLKAGDVVFHDEGHAFPIVTRGHVKQHWSTEDQETFKRYAWPLDSDAHVYAIWENDPRTWRPINHSCDPNLLFAEEHSLNVVAARDIAKGADLTLDYTTFCDSTMEPFDCFCGSASCRKRIFPDEHSLEKYGKRAWHRRLPAAA